MSDSAGSPEDLGKKRKLKVKSEALWLMSFADLSFVLMCFFALLLSFSSMDKQRFENVRDGMLAKSPNEIKNQKTAKKKTNNLKALSKKILEEIKAQNLAAKVTFDAEGVAVEFDPRLFFRSGSASILSTQKHLTDRVLRVIARAPERYSIMMEGHTDDIPMRGRTFATNWDLSAARAVNLLRVMERQGVSPERMSVKAFAHTKPKFPVKGLTGKKLAVARAANRRVVIRIQ